MIKSFSAILSDDFYNLRKILRDNTHYFAHRKDNPLKRELLSEHTTLTLTYFIELVTVNKLDKVINLQITEFVKVNGFDDEDIFLFIKESFVNTIYFHDLGKINENFQIYKMQNNYFLERENGIQTRHSILSTLLFLAYQFDKIYKSKFDNSVKNLLYFINITLSHSILQHHGQLNNPRSFSFEVIDKNVFTEYIEKFELLKEIDTDLFWRLLRNYNRILSISGTIKNGFIPFSLVKLNSSLLTAADYYATNEFMLGSRIKDFGIINDNLRRKVINNTKTIVYNNDLYTKYNYYNSLDVMLFKKKNNKNLNLLRQCLAANVIKKIRTTTENKLFYLEAPTGSGKTNLSILFLTEILEKRNDILKIFYVLPFTTLISQTYDSFKDNLNLNKNEIVEIHSKASFIKSGKDSNYGDKKLNYIDSLFVNFPISLISHVTFFDILTSTSKEKTYLLHRLANSVVIIDEIQSYSPTEWDKVNYLLKKYSDYYNITFLIMSATLPKISKLLIEDKTEDSFVYLVDKRDDYFLNPNFSERVKIDNSLLKETYSEKILSKNVLKVSEQYASENDSVKTIIEFITKKRAFEFYDYLINSKDFSEYKIFLISGTILESRRKEIISYLKCQNNTGKTIVVSTQVIEAGVDIDMDVGFKDKSIIDSEEQLAGRINRNAKKTNAKLFIFNSGDSQNVYRTDLRFRLHLSEKEYLRILLKKNFEYYYQLVFNQINKDNLDTYLSGTLSEFKSFINSSDFKNVSDSFKLIKNNSISIFIPLKIKSKYFSKEEINFINNFLTTTIEDFVDGFDVWDIYERIIKSKIDDFMLRKINIKIISSILSKFTFNIWKNQNDFNVLRYYSLDGEEKYGFLMLNDYKEIYSYEDGLVSNIYDNINFVGF